MNDPKIIRQLIGKSEYEFRIYEKTFMVYRISKKACWGMVREWWYDYQGNEEILNHAISWFVANVLAKEAIKKEKRQQNLKANKEAREKAIEWVKVGDVFKLSFGYDMTINEFFQVVNVKGKKVTVREIAKKTTYWDDGFSGRQQPDLNNFIGEEKSYIISPCGWLKVTDFRHAYKCNANEDYYFNYLD